MSLKFTPTPPTTTVRPNTFYDEFVPDEAEYHDIGTPIASNAEDWSAAPEMPAVATGLRGIAGETPLHRGNPLIGDVSRTTVSRSASSRPPP